MTGLAGNVTAGPTNPLDLVEEIVSSNDWTFDRTSQEEMLVEIAGRWSEYSLYFVWREELSLMQFCCVCEMRIPPNRRAAVNELLAHVNDKLWLGHFGQSPDDNLLTFRQTVLLRGARGASVEQLEDLVDIAVTECDRFYPAFQLVVWGGQSVPDAIAAAMLDPVGEA
jgi:hypothetical protein